MQREITRRNAIRGGAGLAGAATLGGLGLLATSPAVAHLTGDLDFGSNVQLSNDVGDLNFVDVDVDVRVDWTGFEVAVHHIKFLEDLDILAHDTQESILESPHRFYESGIASLSDHAGSSTRNDASDPGTTGWIEAGAPFRLVSEDESDFPPYHAEDPFNGDGDFEPGGDGETLTRTVVFSKRVRLYDENQDPLTGPNSPSWGPADALVEGTFDVSVENVGSGTTSSGSGTTDGDGG